MGEQVLNFNKLKNNGEMTPIPGFSPDMYLCHCPSGNVYSLVSNKWLLKDKKGTGDNNNYLMTSLKGNDGKTHRIYLHELIMSSYMGMSKEEWRTAFGQPLEVNHRSKNTKDCSIGNLELVTSKGNKATKEMVINNIRLSMDVARQLREEFKQWAGNKIDWYKLKAEEFSVSARSIQNIILGNTYKEIEN